MAASTEKKSMGCGALLVVSLIFGVLVVTCFRQGGGGSSSPRSQVESPQQTERPPAYMLVCLDTGERGISASDPRIPRYQRALETLEHRFNISQTMIGDQTWAGVDSLRKQGVETSAIEIMEGAITLNEAQDLGISYAEIVAAVMTLMKPK